ncbi:ImuA family protein [Plastorhodobacter daqingensis]|uniref:ImuA family protein n=1 Tax=Plastorhodobacter daqingensis TaxID=1387281 RepID=A0ABW2UM53_9RHOB
MFWVQPDHVAEQLMPQAMPEGLAAQLHIVRAPSETELLRAAEEILREPAVAAMIAEPQKPLSLKAGRRLQLAAEAGGTLGILLTGSAGGSAAVETRWHCTPLAGLGPEDSTLHRWTLIKNKSGTSGEWDLRWDGSSPAFDMVSATGQRPGAAETSG